MITHSISIENETGLYILDNYNPRFKPRKAVWRRITNLTFGQFATSVKAQNYINRHEKALRHLAEQQGLDGDSIGILNIDCPAIIHIPHLKGV